MDLRTIVKDGQPWFVAKDVCSFLGYTNTPEALSKHVDDDDRAPITICDSSSQGRRMSVINESGLYSLILRSKKPEAQAFKKWVTSVDLPTIRKDGMYMAGEEKVATGELSEDELIAEPLLALNQAERLAAERDAAATPTTNG